MTEWKSRLEADGATVRYVSNRRSARDALSATGDDALDALFIDDVPLTAIDPLWNEIASATTENALRVVTWSLDVPPPLAHSDVRVLTEADLAFTAEEVDALAQANGIDLPRTTLSEITTRYRGNPALARVRLSRLDVSGGVAALANADDRLELHLAGAVTMTPFSSIGAAWQDSEIARMLSAASAMRRVSPGAMYAMLGSNIDVGAYLRRLIALPFGTVEPDHDGGSFVFEWHASIWNLWRSATDPTLRREYLTDALAASRTIREPALELMTLLELGETSEAEALAFDQFRHLTTTPSATIVEAAGTVPHTELLASPGLMMLIGMRDQDSHGLRPEVRRWHGTALEVLTARRGRAPFELLRLATRRAYIYCELGDRAGTLRSLQAIEDLLDADGPDSLLAHARTDGAIHVRMTAELALAFWSATQVDRHGLALRLAATMQRYSDDLSRSAVADRQMVVTQHLLVGREIASEGSARPTTEPLAMLAEGDDEGALDSLRLLEARTRVSASRSGAEALMLTVHALSAPGGPRTGIAADPLAAVERSRARWEDGVASTAVTGAAAVALLAQGNASAGLALVAQHPHHDWFVQYARAVILVATDRPGAAMEALEHMPERADLPRTTAHADALIAAAHCALGRPAAGARHFALALTRTSDAMMRLALRFVTARLVQALADAVADGLPDDDRARAVLHAARSDARVPDAVHVPTLSPVEREVLMMLHAGATNAQIAERRFVSINTVRTQVRALLRKLEAGSRDEAVSRAVALGLIQ